MIKKLKRKFIIITTTAIFIVMMIVLVLVNLATSYVVYREARSIAKMIVENNGKLPENGKPWKYGTYNLNEESPYELRYLVFKDYEDGSYELDLSHVASFSDEEARNLVVSVFDRDDEYGTIKHGKNRYVYYVDKVNGTKIAVVLDYTSRYSSAQAIVVFSGWIGLVCIVLFFLIVMLLSKRAIRPMVDNMEKQKQFITNASHELKTPIAIISANTEVLEMTEGKNEWTESTMKQVARLSGLVNNLVALARLQEKDEVVLEKTDASTITADTAESFRTLIENEGKKLETDIDRDLYVMAEEKGYHELISILMDNAQKYCDDGGVISVRLSAKGRNVTASISNDYKDGEGVDYNRFFERFYREDESHNSSKKGYGIGLSMASELIKIFKGKITVTYNDGSISFNVILQKG